MAFKNILVPTDFSQFSNKAVECALYFAEKYNAKITLLHSILLFQEEGNDGSQLEEYERFVKEKETEIEHKMNIHFQRAKKRGVDIASKVLRGFSAADTILEHLGEGDYDLIVVGTHGRTGIKKWVYGSVAEKIVRFSRVPVLTTHAFENAYRIQKILVPVDFSDFSRKAVQYAKNLAKDFNTQLIFLHTIFNEFQPAYFTTGTESVLILDPELKKRSSEKLEEFVGDVENATFVVTEGLAYQSIVDYAEDDNIDLVVMATRGLTGLDHFLIGSTTERVVRLSKTPVLTIERDK